MNSLILDIRIQQMLMILLLSFMAALLIVGILLHKYRFLDHKKRSGTSSSFSSIMGTIMILSGSVLGAAALIVLIFSFITD